MSDPAKRSAMEMLRGYLADERGGFPNRYVIGAGITIPALALAGYLALTDTAQTKDVEEGINFPDHGWVTTSVENATHANISFSYIEPKDTDKPYRNALLEWVTVTETIPVESEEQCFSEGSDLITRMNRAVPGFAASIDCVNDSEVVSQFQCVVKRGPLSVGNARNEMECNTGGFVFPAEPGADAFDID